MEANDERTAVYPFTLFLRILENEEIGGEIVRQILEDAMKRLHKYKEGFPFSRQVANAFTEIIEQFQENFIWDFFHSHISSHTSSPSLEFNKHTVSSSLDLNVHSFLLTLPLSPN